MLYRNSTGERMFAVLTSSGGAPCWVDVEARTLSRLIPGSGDLIPDSGGLNSRFGLLREFADKALFWRVFSVTK
jgi:hypothetical protein